MKRRAAFTAVESLITILLFAVLLGIVAEVYVGGVKSMSTAVEYNDAMRSVMLAFELMRKDHLCRAYVNETSKDGVLYNTSSVVKWGASQIVAQREWSNLDDEADRIISTPGPDPWKSHWDLVRYTFNPVDDSDVTQLVRQDAQGSHTLGGCYFIGGTNITYSWGFPGNPNHPYIAITLTGAGSLHPRVSYTTTLFLPVTPTFEPTPYLARDAGP